MQCLLIIDRHHAAEMRLFIKFGYIGWEFTGFQSGNGDRSVEDTIRREMDAAGITGRMATAARTDRNVSAISNVLALDTGVDPSRITGVLNSRIPAMIFHSWAEVPDGMNPRHCLSKSYSYMIPARVVRDVGLLRKQISAFTGTHDFSAFSRRDSRNPVRTISHASVSNHGDIIEVELRARSFLWNQIRSIVAFCLQLNAKGEFMGDPFTLKERFPLLADPTRLVLKDIEYSGISFTPIISRSKRRSFSHLLEIVEGRGFVSREFLSAISGINSNIGSE